MPSSGVLGQAVRGSFVRGFGGSIPYVTHPGSVAIADGIGSRGSILHQNTYISGSLITILFDFTDEATGQPADPTNVSLSLSINKVLTAIYVYGADTTIVKDGTGLYHVELDSSALPGTWLYEAVGTGTVQAVGVSGFVIVTPPGFTGTPNLPPSSNPVIFGGNA